LKKLDRGVNQNSLILLGVNDYLFLFLYFVLVFVSLIFIYIKNILLFLVSKEQNFDILMLILWYFYVQKIYIILNLYKSILCW
jgi:hypothetical protein